MNDFEAINGFNAFKLDIYAFKIIVNVSETLIVLSNHLTNNVMESNEIKFVLPPLDAVTDIE